MEEEGRYTPAEFPIGDNRPLVAPFWADVNTLVAGDIFYRETLDQNLLQQATIDVTATSAICKTAVQRGYLLQRGSKWLFMVLKGITETARNEYYL